MNDFFLVERLKEKDEQAFDKLFNKYRNIVYFVIHEIVRNHADAEEILIDTFWQVYEAISSFQSGTNFRAWILKIAKNKAINFYNKKHCVIYDDDYVYQIMQKENHIDDLYADLRKVLSYEEFTVLVLSAVYNITHKDIGKYLNKPTNTISWLYQCAKKKAKEIIK